MQWITENWQSMLGILMGALTLASAITKLTPTPKDDEVVRKIIAWLSFLQPRGAGSIKLPGTAPAETRFQNLRNDDE